MTVPTDSEREERRKADDGDRNEPVYFISRSINYHDDPECRRLNESRARITEMRRGDVLKRTRRMPCLECTVPGEQEVRGDGGNLETRFTDLIAVEATGGGDRDETGSNSTRA